MGHANIHIVVPTEMDEALASFQSTPKLLRVRERRPDVAQINSVFGSNMTPISGLGQPIEGFGARQIQFSLDFEF